MPDSALIKIAYVILEFSSLIKLLSSIILSFPKASSKIHKIEIIK